MTETGEFLTASAYYGLTIFADDRRDEVGGKVSYIGVYNGVMFFPADQPFPLMLPKLSLEVRLFMPLDAKPSEAEITIHFPEDKEDAPTFRQTFPLSERKDIVSDADPSELRTMFLAPLMFSPAPILAPGKIRVRAKIAGETVRLGSLFIRKQPPVEPPAV